MTLRKQLSIGGMILIVMAVILSYANTFHGPFQFDEGLFIASNPYITAETSNTYWNFRDDIERTNAHRIIAILTYLANFKVHGLAVVGYHVVNLAIHLVAALLVYVLVLQLFNTPSMEGSANEEVTKRTAFFTALLFAVHPVQTEAVTYIAGRFISLAGMFYLLTVVLYAQGRLVSVDEQQRGRAAGLIWYAGSIVSAVCAMKTKENAFTVPLIICLYEFLFFSGKVWPRLIRLLPLLMTLAVIPFTSIFVLNWSFDQATWAGKNLSMGISRIEYLFTELTVIMTYLRLLVLPVKQNFLYDYPAYTSFLTPAVFISFLFLLALFGSGIYLVYLSRSRNRGLRIVAFGIFWFFISLSVESSIIPIYNFYIYEYRLYTPSAGFFIAVVPGIFLLAARPGKKTLTAVTLLGIAATILAVTTFTRNTLWKDNVSLWKDVVQKSPRLFMPRNKLGMAYMSSGNYDSAIEVFREIHQLGKLDPVRYRRLVGNNSNAILQQIAVAHLRKAQPNEAFAEFRQELGAEVKAETGHYLFADICYREGLLDLAMKELATALQINPLYTDARLKLGDIYAEKGMTSKAIEEYRQSITARPDSSDARSKLGSLYLNQGDYEKALLEFQAVLQLHPEHELARNNVDWIRNTLKQQPGVGR